MVTARSSREAPGPLTNARYLRTLCAGQTPALGGWCSTSSQFAAEAVSRSGVDWIGIDLQHGLTGPDGISGMLQAAALGGIPAIVRVPVSDWISVGRVLDAGAAGVIVPMVDSAEIARQAVESCKYPPIGKRSWGTTRAAFGEKHVDPNSANEVLVCLAMIETRAACDNLSEILAVPGIDGVFVGPSDLGISVGVGPGLAVTDPYHEGLIIDIAAECGRSSAIAGIYAGSTAAAVRWANAGYNFIVLQSDATLLRSGMAGALDDARAAIMETDGAIR